MPLASTFRVNQHLYKARLILRENGLDAEKPDALDETLAYALRHAAAVDKKECESARRVLTIRNLPAPILQRL